jgi:hypothetical protein
MRTRLLVRGGFAAALVALLMSTVQSSHADDEPEWYPGLPDATFGSWQSSSQGSLSYAKRAQQWFRSPQAMAAAEVQFGADSTTLTWIRAEAYFVSPKGAPANYGYMEPMTVRSVGFGMIPVEATVQVSQRFVDGFPVPVKFKSLIHVTLRTTPDGGADGSDETYRSITITDSFNIRVLSVRVDGVDLGLNGECRTVAPAPATMSSPEYTIYDATEASTKVWYRTHDPMTYYSPIYGGTLQGSMTIPAFTGCTTTAGDDLSKLLTLSVSGPDNPLLARSGWACGFKVGGASAPAPPGVSNPMLGADPTRPEGDGLDTRWCPGVKPFDYPERPKR